MLVGFRFTSKLRTAHQRELEATLRSDLKILRNAVILFRGDCGETPRSLADLAATSPPAYLRDPGKWKGPYVDAVYADPVAEKPFLFDTKTAAVRSAAPGRGSDTTAYATW